MDLAQSRLSSPCLGNHRRPRRSSTRDHRFSLLAHHPAIVRDLHVASRSRAFLSPHSRSRSLLASLFLCLHSIRHARLWSALFRSTLLSPEQHTPLDRDDLLSCPLRISVSPNPPEYDRCHDGYGSYLHLPAPLRRSRHLLRIRHVPPRQRFEPQQPPLTCNSRGKLRYWISHSVRRRTDSPEPRLADVRLVLSWHPAPSNAWRVLDLIGLEHQIAELRSLRRKRQERPIV